MFTSIKWKFIVVYFVLIFIAMVIVGVFILNSLEEEQISNLSNSMEQRLETIVHSSSYLASDNWIENRLDIQETINEWGFSNTETVFVIYDDSYPIIIASSLDEAYLGENALSNKLIDPTLVIRALDGELSRNILTDPNEDTRKQHIAYPVYFNLGQVEGIVYMTSSMEYIYNTVSDARSVLNNATLLALAITILLGFLIASSITEPISDVTQKAEKMAMGDFDQVVEVKSNDEIGQLASMFNHLTFKLKETISEMDLERSKLDTIFNYMAEGIIAIDTQAKIVHANPIAIDILNLSEDYMDKMTLDLDMINLSNIDYKNENLLEGETSLPIDDKMYKIKYAPFKNEKENILGLIMVFQDLTKEHGLDKMRKDFVANVSHELKTPITTIKSYTETLIDREVDENTLKGFLKVINSESDRMDRLVNDLLKLSNIDSKQAYWSEEKINIGQLIDKILNNLKLSIMDKNIKIHKNIPDTLPNILADRDGLEQVIINILTNAIKYSEDKGNIYIKAKVENECLAIRIEDDGIGIPNEDLDRIFERFYRVEKGRSRNMGGTGLGLSIAKEIVEANKGSIDLQSQPNKGTIVTLRFPCS